MKKLLLCALMYPMFSVSGDQATLEGKRILTVRCCELQDMEKRARPSIKVEWHKYMTFRKLHNILELKTHAQGYLYMVAGRGLVNVSRSPEPIIDQNCCFAIEKPKPITFFSRSYKDNHVQQKHHD